MNSIKKCPKHNIYPELFIMEYEEDDPIWKGAIILVIRCNHSVDLGEGRGRGADCDYCTHIDLSEGVNSEDLITTWNDTVMKIVFLERDEK